MHNADLIFFFANANTKHGEGIIIHNIIIKHACRAMVEGAARSRQKSSLRIHLSCGILQATWRPVSEIRP